MKFEIYFRIEIDYSGNGLSTRVTFRDIQHDCILAEDEDIIQLIMYRHLIFGSFPVVGGITIETTHKVCGPFGPVSSEFSIQQGQRLLFMYGKLGSSFDQLVSVFESC